MRTIAVINQKGGVGKTTTTVNLGYALTLLGNKVTVIDLDPQSHLSSSLGINSREYAGMDEILLHNAPLAQSLIKVRENLHLVPAGAELAQIEHLSEGGAKKGARLRQALKGQLQDQDYVLIDCPPASGILAVNALLASDEVIIPVTGDYLSLQGLSFLIATIRNFEQKLGHKLKQWIVLTRFHTRRRLPKEVLSKILEYFPQQVFATHVRETAALAECPGAGKTIFEYRSSDHGATDYRQLADDLVNRRTISCVMT